jgi:hypothetical protein
MRAPIHEMRAPIHETRAPIHEMRAPIHETPLRSCPKVGSSAGELEGSGRAPLAPEWTSAARCTSPRRTTERSVVNMTRHDGACRH